MQLYPSADNWIKALLSKALPTRARSSFSHAPPSHQDAYTSLSLIHQREDRKTKKQHSLTAAETKTVLQKINHHEKAESYVPDEGTR